MSKNKPVITKSGNIAPVMHPAHAMLHLEDNELYAPLTSLQLLRDAINDEILALSGRNGYLQGNHPFDQLQGLLFNTKDFSSMNTDLFKLAACAGLAAKTITLNLHMKIYRYVGRTDDLVTAVKNVAKGHPEYAGVATDENMDMIVNFIVYSASSREAFTLTHTDIGATGTCIHSKYYKYLIELKAEVTKLLELVNQDMALPIQKATRDTLTNVDEIAIADDEIRKLQTAITVAYTALTKNAWYEIYFPTSNVIRNSIKQVTTKFGGSTNAATLNRAMGLYALSTLHSAFIVGKSMYELSNDHNAMLTFLTDRKGADITEAHMARALGLEMLEATIFKVLQIPHMITLSSVDYIIKSRSSYHGVSYALPIDIKLHVDQVYEKHHLSYLLDYYNYLASKCNASWYGALDLKPLLIDIISFDDASITTSIVNDILGSYAKAASISLDTMKSSDHDMFTFGMALKSNLLTNDPYAFFLDITNLVGIINIIISEFHASPLHTISSEIYSMANEFVKDNLRLHNFKQMSVSSHRVSMSDPEIANGEIKHISGSLVLTDQAKRYIKKDYSFKFFLASSILSDDNFAPKLYLVDPSQLIKDSISNNQARFALVSGHIVSGERYCKMSELRDSDKLWSILRDMTGRSTILLAKSLNNHVMIKELQTMISSSMLLVRVSGNTLEAVPSLLPVWGCDANELLNAQKRKDVIFLYDEKKVLRQDLGIVLIDRIPIPEFDSLTTFEVKGLHRGIHFSNSITSTTRFIEIKDGCYMIKKSLYQTSFVAPVNNGLAKIVSSHNDRYVLHSRKAAYPSDMILFNSSLDMDYESFVTAPDESFKFGLKEVIWDGDRDDARTKLILSDAVKFTYTEPLDLNKQQKDEIELLKSQLREMQKAAESQVETLKVDPLGKNAGVKLDVDIENEGHDINPEI